MKNIVLIGMPSAGKSTIGIILAKVLGYKFLDSDLVIQEQEQALLKDIIEEKGLEGFLAIENQVNRDIQTESTVIATGGSIIYCLDAMEKFRDTGIIVYIKLKYETIKNRLGNIKQRGVVFQDGQTLKSLYNERCPLYEEYAHIIIDGENLDQEELMEKIASAIQCR
ncbi:shikimate kinase [Anaerocolumna cellulosilytica]|uniref:Shikimate kinase n=1 Tax=Anaerocolumna cellulosilytica TaxID=433286 RepID=A0A6S6R402_9FIRM|nr:shikimate kinase [Anaerocolumna cellulosilytica]MBB5195846.1 shikimate kinase [Anaerocolumna cellulosilytica]BCJ96856.1 shikimate kinase [Anaerocolumna cellulosilytica]